ncbi:unnamed protein product [Acidithrix sp. C25]|nr:unnamed protein product [Acidithrix sp. C25]
MIQQYQNATSRLIQKVTSIKVAIALISIVLDNLALESVSSFGL